jgi:hypothetical protein
MYALCIPCLQSRKLGHWECCAGCKKTGICSRNRVIR